MSNDLDWNGLEVFLAGSDYGEWGHYVVQDVPSYLESHEENVEQVEEFREAYKLAYGVEEVGELLEELEQ